MAGREGGAELLASVLQMCLFLVKCSKGKNFFGNLSILLMCNSSWKSKCKSSSLGYYVLMCGQEMQHVIYKVFTLFIVFSIALFSPSIKHSIFGNII